ncbi:MAG TPA: hypothetical protein VLF66_00770 [Thermoanaerobaculia bacterium]|nr:hypothetical protein [Thermoanaerobaculia bacterium]
MPPLAPRLLRRLLSASLLAVVATAPAAAAQPSVTFEPTAVVASGMAPETEVVFHGVTREHRVYYWHLVQTRDVVPADAEGVARLELPEGVGPVSLWTAVDSGTGEFGIGSPEGFTPNELPFPGNGIDRAANGAWRVLRSRFERAEVLYVRPGVGAWWLLGVDGGSSDEDGREDSQLGLSLELARPLWREEPPPEEFAAGDVVVAVSLDTLDFFAARLSSPGQPN